LTPSPSNIGSLSLRSPLLLLLLRKIEANASSVAAEAAC
jgi:hypothetical protein